MVDLLSLQKQFILAHLGAGDCAVDFTMGNGNDTVFLSRTVGKTGRVYAFDVQERALAATRARLLAEGAPENYTLICASHHRVREFVSEPIKAGMFNLGYLPGSGNTVTTLQETTLPAVCAALDLLAPDGVLLVAVYPGHEEGRLEGEMLSRHFASLNRYLYCASCFRILNSPTSPYFFFVEKREDRPLRHPGRAARHARRAAALAAALDAGKTENKENGGPRVLQSSRNEGDARNEVEGGEP